jgi:hypothetical protein
MHAATRAIVLHATPGRVAVASAATLAGALAWLSSAFHGVPLRYDPSGVGPGCPALLPATREALDRAAFAPGIALLLWLAGSAVVVVRVARERLPAGWGVRAGASVVGASAALGALLCFELYAYRSPLLAFVLFFVVPTAVVASGLVMLAGTLVFRAPTAVRRWRWAVWGLFVVDVLVLPWVVGATTQTDEAFVCL